MNPKGDFLKGIPNTDIAFYQFMSIWVTLVEISIAGALLPQIYILFQ